MRYQKYFVALSLCAAIWLVATPQVRAALISVDGWSLGDGRLTADTETGLTWLDLSATNDRSFDDIFVNDLGGLMSLGFRGATLDEVTELFFHAGAALPILDGRSQLEAITYDAASNFISLFGCTACIAVYSAGYVVSASNGARYGTVEMSSDLTGRFVMSGGDQLSYDTEWGRAHHQLGTGFYLVTPTANISGLLQGVDPAFLPPTGVAAVPEPGTLALFGAAIASLAMVRRRRGLLF